ncbi:transposase [mine drainage metagenome]|uniref:Transposase n=1 Tax=mine drainage metagenome TaxID=410659 RepID=T0YKR7_9ZZZZ
MDIECTGRRFENARSLEREVGAWTRKRNRDRKKIKWGFDRKQADKKLSKYYTGL